jgi:hypothetical protein
LIEGFPTGEDFEFGEGNGDFGFVVGVGELVGVILVQASGEVFVRMDLERKCFLN